MRQGQKALLCIEHSLLPKVIAVTAKVKWEGLAIHLSPTHPTSHKHTYQRWQLVHSTSGENCNRFLRFVLPVPRNRAKNSLTLSKIFYFWNFTIHGQSWTNCSSLEWRHEKLVPAETVNTSRHCRPLVLGLKWLRVSKHLFRDEIVIVKFECMNHLEMIHGFKQLSGTLLQDNWLSTLHQSQSRWCHFAGFWLVNAGRAFTEPWPWPRLLCI